MPKQKDIERLTTALKRRHSSNPGEKTQGYVGKFWDTERIGTKITGKVEGNHGTYRVSVWLEDDYLRSACSCYIGKHGNCYHTNALGLTFLETPNIFKEIKQKKRKGIKELDDINSYLRQKTLDELLKELKAKGITQKAFAESIGMNPRHLGSIKSSEKRNRFYNELGATKLAVLWVLEHIAKKKS